MELTDINIDIAAICITALLSFLGLSLAVFFGVFFGLRSFRKGIMDKLGTMSDMLIKIEERSRYLWERTKGTALGEGGKTLEIQLKNFGKTKISALPRAEDTVYTIETEIALDTEYMQKVSVETGLWQIEEEWFKTHPVIIPLTPNTARLIIPSVNKDLCIKYIGSFLHWLDSEYFNALGNLKDFEKGISFSGKS